MKLGLQTHRSIKRVSVALPTLALMISIIVSPSCCKEQCSTPQEPDVVYVPPLDAGDGGTETDVEATTTCGKACLNLRKNGCQEGLVTPAGSRCYDVCKSAPSLLRADCVAAAKTIDELKRCGVRCAR